VDADTGATRGVGLHRLHNLTQPRQPLLLGGADVACRLACI
jgi:hypothetical protein